MNGFQLEIARFLAAKAARRSRATYQQVGEAVGWSHPHGRGLGAHLWIILHELADLGLPPLTAILVRKGERYPEEGAMAYIRGALGDVNIDALQHQVFNFDWASVPDLAPAPDSLPDGRAVWLTSFWGFAPDQWGCIGFSDEPKRTRFLTKTKPGVLVAIYVTKNKGDPAARGKVIGAMEVSHEAGHAQQFISGDQWAKKEADPDSRGKWLYALRATRAWRIIREDWQDVDGLFPAAYASADPQFIGAAGVPLGPEEAEMLLQLDVYEVPIYGQNRPLDTTISTLETALTPSRAIPPADSGYWVGETDGPKHLYILKLEGDIAAYLGRRPAAVEDKAVIKVGFSKSPLSRCDQIQAAYPAGAFRWTVFRPQDMSAPAPYANARVAIAGEDAMKARLVKDGAESLGGEFFLADDWLVHAAWTSGRVTAEAAQAALAPTPETISPPASPRASRHLTQVTSDRRNGPLRSVQLHPAAFGSPTHRAHHSS